MDGYRVLFILRDRMKHRLEVIADSPMFARKIVRDIYGEQLVKFTTVRPITKGKDAKPRRFRTL